ncbi:hypothetical protein PRK78_005571 [Emydomyces testavorans]|uniref:Uncharacterized protein n=1 Tax=Emydomyces testavorans TaxID=2070801 RepID=A0AAF0IKS0_9EURO|nr:hypothetical protein PRK78_005571 [Emydomyces testavorans]
MAAAGPTRPVATHVERLVMVKARVRCARNHAKSAALILNVVKSAMNHAHPALKNARRLVRTAKNASFLVQFLATLCPVPKDA